MSIFDFFRRRSEPAPEPLPEAEPERVPAPYVPAAQAEVVLPGSRAGAAALADSALVTAVEASIPDARRLVAQCQAAGISALLGGEACGMGGGCAPKAAVRVARRDVPRVKELLEKMWAADLEREGIDPAAVARLQAAERSGKPHCPACGHIGALVGGACADCGLEFG